MVVLDQLRFLEWVGAVVSLTFALLGVNALLTMNENPTMTELLHVISTSLFLIFFGMAGAILCAAKSQSMASSFGFLVTWSGRWVFFLVMGLYLYPVVCPKTLKSCFSNSHWVTQLGIAATIASIVLGVLILILRCTTISESFSSDMIGQRRQTNIVDIASMVASIGMLILGFRLLFAVDINGPVRKVCQAFAFLFIILTFGAASLVASFRSSGFVSAFFGFLDRGWQRGIFYVLMGFYTFSRLYDNHEGIWNFVCFICSGVSIVVGTIILVLSCR
mmetsp:Transcript_71031/g.201297  ORF Transcript_71031/g.201297 Transcript_71031/m.201297 type:complete len:276 (+) Transcript_71031:107-934(+)